MAKYFDFGFIGCFLFFKFKVIIIFFFIYLNLAFLKICYSITLLFLMITIYATCYICDVNNKLFVALMLLLYLL